MTSDLAVYILARTDLPSMNPGKAMSQVHHAGVQMMTLFYYYPNPIVREYLDQGLAKGADGFNTTIVLGASLNQIYVAGDKAFDLGYIFKHVTDPSYPFVVDAEIAKLIPETNGTKIVKVLDNGKVLMVREELTCSWFIGDRNDAIFRSLFDGLDLHP